MTFNLCLFILVFRSECADFSLYIYLSVYLIHGNKQQKSEHGIEARFYEIERNYRGDEHFDDRLNTGAHEDSGKDEVERYHDEGHQHRADRESRRHALFAADFLYIRPDARTSTPDAQKCMRKPIMWLDELTVNA